MVVKDSDFASIEDLSGAIVGTVKGSASKRAIENEARLKGIKLYFTEFASVEQNVAALLAGEIDAFSNSKYILRSCKNDNVKIFNQGYGIVSYGIGSRVGDPYLASSLDEIVSELEENGTLRDLRTKWL
jgi:ABC-type amino acid transport substrate-binding protein